MRNPRDSVDARRRAGKVGLACVLASALVWPLASSAGHAATLLAPAGFGIAYGARLAAGRLRWERRARVTPLFCEHVWPPPRAPVQADSARELIIAIALRAAGGCVRRAYV